MFLEEVESHELYAYLAPRMTTEQYSKLCAEATTDSSDSVDTATPSMAPAECEQSKQPTPKPNKLKDFINVLSNDTPTEALTKVHREVLDALAEISKRETRRNTTEPINDKVETILKILALKTSKFKVSPLKEVVAFNEITRPDITIIKNNPPRSGAPLYLVDIAATTEESLAALVRELRHLCV